MPYINVDAILDFSDKENREDVIMDMIIQHLPPGNKKFHIEHDQKANSFTVKGDPDQAEKTVVVTLISAADKNVKMFKLK